MQADKYTVAWFKIADCVSRGEKERALGVYRLLSHSFNDAAIAQQLEGDIHLSFNDRDRAIPRYYKAAQLYKKSGRILEAAAIYEHIVILEKDAKLYRMLIDLYMTLGVTIKIQKFSSLLAAQYVYNRDWKSIEEVMDMFSDDMFIPVRSSIYYTILVAMKEKEESIDRIHDYIETALNDFSVQDDQKSLQEFLSAVQAIDDDLYEYAFDYLKTM